jgi:hypothetical protein
MPGTATFKKNYTPTKSEKNKSGIPGIFCRFFFVDPCFEFYFQVPFQNVKDQYSVMIMSGINQLLSFSIMKNT